MQHRDLNIFAKYIGKLFLKKIIKKIFYSNLNKLFFSSVSLVWSIGILFRCVVSLKVKTYSFTLKQVLSNFMIFKGKDFIQYASNKQITFDKLSNSEKKEIKIMKAETLFRINLFYLPNPTPKSGTTFYREGWVYYYYLSTALPLSKFKLFQFKYKKRDKY